MAAPGAACLNQGGKHADSEQHGAAAAVGHQVQLGNGIAAFFADGMQRSGKRKVVDVMTGGTGQGAGLPSARHPTINQARVADQADIRPQAEALHDPRPKTFDQSVGASD